MKGMNINPSFVTQTLDLGKLSCFAYQRSFTEELSEKLHPNEAIFFLKLMRQIRSFETLITQLRSGQLVPYEGYRFCGATHISIGQEAVAVGACSSLLGSDYITSTHRGHGHGIAKRAFALRHLLPEELEAYCEGYESVSDKINLFERAMDVHMYRTMAEFLGKEDGYCRGRGGGMHIADFHCGHLGANAIVGGSVPIATGAAMSMMLQGNDNVVLCFHGDGSINNGVWSESVNMACMAQFREKGIPIIYLIENNQYGMTGQSYGEVTGINYLARRGFAYADNGMHAEVVNGMDILAVRDAVTRAVDICRNKGGPVLLEMLTYRFVGHTLSDQERYRSKEEVDAWKKEDAIIRLENQLIEAGILTEQQVKELRKEIEDHSREMMIRAANSTDPDPSGLLEGLSSDTDSNDIGDELKATEYNTKLVRDTRNREGMMTMRNAIREALIEEMIRDKRVVFYGEDVGEHGGAFAVTVGMYEIFGRNRVFNTAISEAAICGSAVGMALTGMRPVIELMFIDFILMSMDQIGNQAAKFKYMHGGNGTIPWTMRTTIGGGKGYAGQHSQSLEAIPAHIPGIKIVAPSTPADAKGLLKSAIRDDNPVIVLEHQLLYADKGLVSQDDYIVPLGKASVTRKGNDITIIAYSYMAKIALQAAELLVEKSIFAEVIDIRTLVPLDVRTIVDSVKKTKSAVVLSQAPNRCSFAEHISAQVMKYTFEDLIMPVNSN